MPRRNKPWLGSQRQQWLKHWRDFVTNIVTHYKADVHDWEIENEPNVAFSDNGYTDVLRVASQTIRRVDPQANIVAFSGGGFHEPMYRHATKTLGTDAFDTVSVHLYGNIPQTHAAFGRFVEKVGKPAWNTETGPSCPTFYTAFADFDSLYEKGYWQRIETDMRGSATQQLRNYLTSLSVGRMTRYFHYFARFVNSGPSQPTRWFGGGKELAEYDGSLRGNAVALSIASHLLDATTYQGQADVADGQILKAHVFAGASGSVAFAWAPPGLTLRLKLGDMPLRVLDMMGNRMDTSKLTLGAFPIYLLPESPDGQASDLLKQIGMDVVKSP